MNSRALTCSLLLMMASSAGCLAQEDGPDTRLYDTVAPLVGPLTRETFGQRSGWHQIAEDSRPDQIAGDAVMLNDKLVVVFQRRQPGPGVYSKLTGRLLASAALIPPGAAAPGTIERVSVLENTAGAVKLGADFGGGSAQFRLTTGEGIVEVQSSDGAAMVQVQSDTKYLLVPDYFGDDMVYRPAPAQILLPAENFCLSLLGAGDTILMTVWQSRQQDTSFALSGQAPTTRTTCAKGKSIWLAILEQPGLWRAQPGLAENWTPPFVAKWRCSFVRSGDAADSWDREQGPRPEQKGGEHGGPLLTYLIDRTPATPLTASCPTDVMRNTLGVGPCQYILACEGMGAQGDPTPNTVMGWVEKQFQQKKQKKAAADIQERLGFMTRHIAEAHTKIARYADFAGSNLKRFSSSAPEPLLALLRDLAGYAALGLAPDAAPKRAEQLAGEVKALVSQENGQAACLRLGEQLRAVGAIQDRALARCRMTVRRLRQEARTIAATEPASALMAQQIQSAAEEQLASR